MEVIMEGSVITSYSIHYTKLYDPILLLNISYLAAKFSGSAEPENEPLKNWLPSIITSIFLLNT